MTYKIGDWKTVLLHTECSFCEAESLTCDYKYGHRGYVYDCDNCHNKYEGENFGCTEQKEDYEAVLLILNDTVTKHTKKDIAIMYLNMKVEIERLKKNNERMNQLYEENKALMLSSARIKKVNKWLSGAIEQHVNQMLRQTIAGETHGERNQELRKWSTELMRLVKIAHNDTDNIPF